MEQATGGGQLAPAQPAQAARADARWSRCRRVARGADAAVLLPVAGLPVRRGAVPLRDAAARRARHPAARRGRARTAPSCAAGPDRGHDRSPPRWRWCSTGRAGGRWSERGQPSDRLDLTDQLLQLLPAAVGARGGRGPGAALGRAVGVRAGRGAEPLPDQRRRRRVTDRVRARAAACSWSAPSPGSWTRARTSARAGSPRRCARCWARPARSGGPRRRIGRCPAAGRTAPRSPRAPGPSWCARTAPSRWPRSPRASRPVTRRCCGTAAAGASRGTSRRCRSRTRSPS